MSVLTARAMSLADYLDAIDAQENEDPDRRFVLGDLRNDLPAFSGDPEAGFMQYKDFKYPFSWFETDTPVAIRDGDTSLIGTWLLPTDVLRSDAFSADRILTYDAFRERARAVADAVGGSDDPVFVIGAHSPDRNWERYGGKSSDAKRWGGVHFPNRFFKDQEAIDPLKQSPITFSGTAVVERAALTDDLLAFVGGDRERPPLGAGGDPPSMTPDEVVESLGDVEPGDTVHINDRQTPLRVVTRDEADIIPSTRSLCLLNGNGTSYRIVDEGEDHYPTLEYASDSEAVVEVEVETQTDAEANEVTA